MRNFILGTPGVLELPDDEKLVAQLSTRKWRMGGALAESAVQSSKLADKSFPLKVQLYQYTGLITYLF
jgi:hypothetical protein